MFATHRLVQGKLPVEVLVSFGNPCVADQHFAPRGREDPVQKNGTGKSLFEQATLSCTEYQDTRYVMAVSMSHGRGRIWPLRLCQTRGRSRFFRDWCGQSFEAPDNALQPRACFLSCMVQLVEAWRCFAGRSFLRGTPEPNFRPLAQTPGHGKRYPSRDPQVKAPTAQIGGQPSRSLSPCMSRDVGADHGGMGRAHAPECDVDVAANAGDESSLDAVNRHGVFPYVC